MHKENKLRMASGMLVIALLLSSLALLPGTTVKGASADNQISFNVVDSETISGMNAVINDPGQQDGKVLSRICEERTQQANSCDVSESMPHQCTQRAVVTSPFEPIVEGVLIRARRIPFEAHLTICIHVN